MRIILIFQIIDKKDRGAEPLSFISPSLSF